jgi:hypothetical protein
MSEGRPWAVLRCLVGRTMTDRHRRCWQAAGAGGRSWSTTTSQPSRACSRARMDRPPVIRTAENHSITVEGGFAGPAVVPHHIGPVTGPRVRQAHAPTIGEPGDARSAVHACASAHDPTSEALFRGPVGPLDGGSVSVAHGSTGRPPAQTVPDPRRGARDPEAPRTVRRSIGAGGEPSYRPGRAHQRAGGRMVREADHVAGRREAGGRMVREADRGTDAMRIQPMPTVWRCASRTD